MRRFKIQDLFPFREPSGFKNISFNQEGFIRFTKKSLASTLLASILVTGTGVLYLFGPFAAKTEAAWFDDSWSYRQRVDVTNSGSAQTDFQVSFTLDTNTLFDNGKLQADCDDIRVTDVNGRVLPYWIEQMATACGDSNSGQIIWTKVPSIATSGATLYVYYGNPSASAYSDGNRVFEFFDEFSGSTIDATKWTTTGSPSISGGSALFDAANEYITELNNMSTTTSTIVEYRAQRTSTSGFGTFEIATNSCNLTQWWYAGGSLTFKKVNAGCGFVSDSGATIGSYSINTWYKLRVQSTLSSGDILTNAALDGSTTVSNYSYGSASNTSFTKVILGSHPTVFSGNFLIDWVFVRKNATTLPTVAAPTNEEKAPSPVAYWKFDEGQGVVASNSQWKSSSTSVTNLVKNSSFETGVLTSSWECTANGGNGTCSASSDTAIFGNYSGKVTTGADTDATHQLSNIAAGAINTTASTAYTFSAWAKSTTGTVTLQVRGASGTPVTNYISTATMDGTWKRIVVNATTLGAGDGSTTIFLYLGNNTTGAVTYFDGIQFEQSSNATNYCDGSLGGNGTHSFAGTTHLSNSICSNGTDGMISSATWQNESQCVSGKCLLFDGSNDVVSSPDHPAFALGSIGSLSAWIRTSQSGVEQGIIGQYNGGVAGGIHYTVNAGGKLSYHDGSSFFLASNASVNDGKWHHVVYVQASATSHILYVDGVQDNTSSTSSTFIDSIYPMQVGALMNSSAPSSFFKGSIDEPKIYNFALSAAQVKAQYVAKTGDEGGSVLGSTNQDKLSSGLVGYWKMDEASANSCTGGVNDSCDSSGNANNGAWTGDTTTTSGKFGNATTYDGTGDYTDLGSGSSLNITGAVTLSAWVNPSNVTGYKMIIARSGGNLSTTQYELRILNNGVDMLLTNGSTVFSAQASGVLTANMWHHIVGTFDGTTVKVYVNDVKGTDATFTGTQSTYSASNPAIGRRGDNFGNFVGKIDEARIYNRALSPAEVSQLYNFAPGPVGYWNFEEKASPSKDTSGYNNNGTWNGNTTSIAGKYGSGVTFDGNGDYIEVPETTSTDVNQFTISGWIKISAEPDNFDHIISKTDGDSGFVVDFDQNASRGIYLAAYNTSNAETNTASVKIVPTVNVWKYFTFTFDGTNIRTYNDGVLTGTTAFSGTFLDSTHTLMSFGDAAHFAGNYFAGQLDDVRLYNYPRSAKQVIEDMNANHPAPGSPVGSPVGHWRFDEGYSTTANNSGNAGSTLNGTLTNAGGSNPTWSQSGKFGKALSFDPTVSSDRRYVSVGGSPAALNVPSTAGESITISTWMNPSATQTGSGWWIRNGLSGFDENYGLSLPMSGGLYGILFEGYSSGAFRSAATTGYYITPNQWNHVVVVFTQGQNYKLYVNGVLRETVTFAFTTVQPTTGFAIGGNPGAFQNYNGLLDEVKIYQGALTADQIKLDMNQGSSQILGAVSDKSTYEKQAANQEYCVPGDSTSCAAPVGRWDLDEMTGITINDKSGNGNTGTVTGGPTWQAGKVNGALNFDGSGDYITVTDSTSLDATSVTVEAWINPSINLASMTGWAGVVQKLDFGGADANNAYGIVRQNNDPGKLIAFVYTSNGAATYATTTTFVANTWYHIAFTATSGAQRLYVNGVLEGSGGLTGTINNSNKNLIIGANRLASSEDWYGKIDQVRVFNYARTPSQIAWDYNRGAPTAHWRMDECQGTTANDSSGNGNTGTITVGGSGTYTSAGTCASGTSTHAWAGGVAGAGKRNYALSFDGTDDRITTSTSVATAATMTIAGWIKKNSSTAQRSFFSNRGAGGRVYFGLSGTQVFLFDDGVGGVVSPSGSVTIGSWQHVAVTNDGSTTRMYVNGNLVHTQAQARISSTGTVGIGWDPSIGTEYWDGQIDDVRVYNYTMTPTQIKSLYSDGAVNFAPVTGAP